MIKAIIFDCFGVLTSEGWIGFKKKHFAGLPEKSRRATELNRMLDAGRIEYREGVQSLADLAGVPWDEVDTMLRDVVPNDELIAYIRDNLKPRYRLGILSNVSGNWLESFLAEEDHKLFDVIELSYESGVLKPDIQAYKSVATKLSVEPGECVFIDDQERHCEGARRAGMRAILYKGFEQVRGELERMLSADAER